MNNNIVINLENSKALYAAYEAAFPLKKLLPLYQFDTAKSVDENLNSLALFALHGSTTLPIFYSFKDIFLDLVSRWVSFPEQFESQYYQEVVSEQSNTVKGSLILSALSRLIHISNESLNLVELFVSKAEIFSILSSRVKQNNSPIASEELEAILLSFYRLISYDNHRFKHFIIPDVLYSIIRSEGDHNVAKYLAIKILSIYLSASEEAQTKMVQTHIGDVDLKSKYETDENLDYKFLPLLEAKRLSNFSKLPKANTITDVTKRGQNVVISSSDLSSLVTSICGVLVPNVVGVPIDSTDNTTDTDESNFVATEGSVQVLRQLAHHIQNNRPVMLYGKAGSGKSFLINQLASYMSYENSIVKIHLGEQTDAKLLLGTYSSGEKPGTFQWRSGVLTTAVREGKWVLIEDIDKAPTEVLSILLTLLEKRELTIPSRGEVIKAKNGFQLISTVRINDDSKFTLPDLIGLRLWELIKVQVPSEVDLKNILVTKFPLLSNLIIPFIKCYNEITRIYSLSSFISLNKGSHPRVISFRDLMKFCSRCNAMLSNEGITSSSQLLESTVYDNIFAEAVDCFGSAITEQSALEPLVNAIGDTLEVASSRINLFLTKHIPNYINDEEKIKIGRATLHKSDVDKALYINKKTGNNTSFARTNHSLRLMEQIAVSIEMAEPVLLVGETGTGKTTVVQQIAKQMNKKLTVINVSQQTEAGDLLGGYKPVNTKTVAVPLQEIFENLFIATFSEKKNEKFSRVLSKCFNKNQWKNVIKLWREALRMSKDILAQVEDSDEDGAPKKKRKLKSHEKNILLDRWVEFEQKITEFELQSSSLENSFVFNFVEGSLVKAVRDGEWLLLDEINLASADTLESIADLLSESINQRSVLLTEKGDVESIKAHPQFRIFGCMNPSTDVGKRDLPLSIRSRFSEIYVHSPDRDINDLLSIIDKYIGRYAIGDEWAGNDIAELYLSAKRLSESNQIVDGANQRPHFSIRTLTRTLIYVCDIVSIYGLRRSLYEGFCMAFLTLLDSKSEEILRPVIVQHTIGRLKNAKSVMSQCPPAPSSNSEEYVQFRHYWMKHGPQEIVPQPHYIITPFVEKNMLNLVRATAGRRFPVLVQGPTSAGKTSMIKYLANITGHKFVRINNHEHTDLQEYLGTYVSDSTGKLSFKEGILVEALRKGHWIVLDELNLAPTDVLEALNRLLDDNRELFIPETQEVVHPHPDFMLFATQNPPGIYGGRKVLSRAFRNRFLELHFDDIPQDELEVILKERCQIAPSYCKKIVEVYRNLSIQRQSTRLFEQKNSFATLRDLFRWALREAVGYEELAANGYMLLAERVRKEDEKRVVKETIEKVMRVKLDMDAYYKSLENEAMMSTNSDIVWTKAMRRLAVLVFTSMKYKEPLLLVGETGCGKTTVCQIIAQYLGRELVTVNAHQNTETGDILGAQRPVRNRFESQKSLITNLVSLFSTLGIEVSAEDMTMERLLVKYDSISKEKISPETVEQIRECRRNAAVLFEWNDGPLVRAMKDGSFFLLDEISLADDSVLERLNSVLEPERSLLLAEKGTDDVFVTAASSFEFLATMNPGGDYGKKELSPALRNRFTEIWVPSMEDFNDVKEIVADRLVNKKHVDTIVKFSEWYGKKFGGGHADSGVISLRDILAWVQFINSCGECFDTNEALLHGASMVFIDALGTNNTAYLAENELRLRDQKVECVEQLSEIAGIDLLQFYRNSFNVSLDDNKLNAGSFSLPRVHGSSSTEAFNLHAPTTSANAMRVIRAMQVHKPILLEGSPGVGKTSLVSAISKATGNYLVRINLSEQTDLVDLFGSDAPAEGGKTGEFVWRDAPFLRAMQRGEWVLLDEMNLASQSVLEGLNACLDHRGEAYIPELDKSFSCHPNFKVFAAQNPQYQGGGRKGLPKSFVNRFSVVYVDTLKSQDLNMISQHLYPQINQDICSKIIEFMSKLEDEVVIHKRWGSSGGPWEFNLRDTLRWLELLNTQSITEDISPADFLEMIVLQRFRSDSDRYKAVALFESIFGTKQKRDNYYAASETYLQAGGALSKKSRVIQHNSGTNPVPLQSNFAIIETFLRCINKNTPLILTGPSNSGKTELIRFVANAVGAQVDEFAMNSDVDSMDILGGYEQVDLTRAIGEITSKVKEYLNDLVVTNLSVSSSQFTTLSQSLALIKYLSSQEVTTSNYSEFHSFIKSFLSFYSNDRLLEMVEQSAMLDKRIKEEKSVKFEWFDGLLVKAVEKGHWLVLDNANLCSPSVLDRLNSLLETNGSLIINECSNEDGQPRTLEPHPDFRLFLTMNPKYGELSRAMRNRGIEIHLEMLSDRVTEFDSRILGYLRSRTDNDLNKRFENLTVSESIFKPTVGFLQPTESLIRPFALMDDVLNFGDLVSSETINASLSVLPLIYANTVAGWYDLVSCSSDFDSKTKEAIAAVRSKIDFLNNDGIISKLANLFQQTGAYVDDIVGAKTNFSLYQSLHPQFNNYLLASLSKTASGTDSSEPTLFFEVVSGIIESNQIRSSIEGRALNGRISSLNYIERSAAYEMGRDIKSPPKLKVFKFVVELIEFIYSAFESSVDKAVFSNDSTYKSLYELQKLFNGMVRTAETQNESKLRIYQELISKWIESYGENEFIVSDISKLKSSLNAFGDSLALTTGFSMDRIWEHFRCNYPQNEESWKSAELLIQLANDFDDAAREQFVDVGEYIVQLRVLFDELYNSLLSGGFDSAEYTQILTTLQDGISKLSDASASFVYKRQNSLEVEFALVSNYVSACAQESDIAETDLAYLATLANKKTLSSLRNKSNAFNPYPAIFDDLWIEKNGKAVSLTDGLFSSDIARNLLDKSVTFGMTPGKYLQQNLEDFRLMGNVIVRHSGEILTDQKDVSKRMLLAWLVKILEPHFETFDEDAAKDFTSCLQSLEKEGFVVVEDFISCLEKSNEPHFVKIAVEFFIPSVILLNQKLTIGSLGKAWVLFSCGAIQLFVPSSPYDPAIREYIIYEKYEEQKEASERLVSSWRAVRTVYSGDDKIHIEECLPTMLNEDIPSKPKVYRRETTINALFEEWKAFMESSIDVTPVGQLLQSAESLAKSSEKMVDIFQKNSSKFLYRLKQNYLSYSDLNDILRGYVYGLKLGFNLLSLDGKQRQAAFTFDDLWSVNPSIIASEEHILTMFEHVKVFNKKISIDSLASEQLMAFFMKACFAYNPRKLNSDFSEVLLQTFQSLYYRWSLRRIKEEEESVQKGSLYKYTDPDVDIEGDFRTLFPDYDEVIDTDLNANKNNESFESLYFTIAKSYTDHYLHRKEIDLTTLVNEGTDLSQLLSTYRRDITQGDINPSVLSSMVIKLGETYRKFNNISAAFNFYHDCSPVESKRAISIIAKIHTSVSKLLEQWPEHATLQNIAIASDEFLMFSLDTPVSRLLQKVEQIFTLIAEWQKYASSQVSLQDLYNELTTLIVSWRRLELSTWKSIFLHEEETLEKSIGKWWFHLFESILVPVISESDDFSQSTLLTALNYFMSKTTYGEFLPRLNLLKAFKNHVSQLTTEKKLFNTLSNFISFYEQFIPSITESITATKKKLEKDMSEVILLASWKDVNIDALKQSARKSHNSLYKIVRKYRSLLSTPVSPLIESGISTESKSVVVLKTIDRVGTIVENNDIALCSAVTSWYERPARLQNLSVINTNMEVYITRVASENLPNLMDFAKELFEEMERLRNETPKDLKEGNKKVIAALKTQKKKLLSDTLKELRRMGLKTTLRTDIMKSQSGVNMIVANSSTFEGTELEDTDVFFYRILDLLPRLRAAVANVAEDIPQIDADKGLAVAENLIHTLVATREPLRNFTEKLPEFRAIYNTLNGIANSRNENVDLVQVTDSESIDYNLSEIKSILFWLPKLIEFATRVIESTELFTQKASPSVFYDCKLQLVTFEEEYKKLDTSIYTSKTKNFIARFGVFYSNFKSNLIDWKSKNLRVAFVADVILSWISSAQYDGSIQSSTSLTILKSLEDVERTLRDVSSSIIVAVQKVIECQEGDLSEENDNWFVLTQQRIMKYIKALHSKSILYKLNKCLDVISSVQHNHESSNITSALVSFTLPLVNHYYRLTLSVFDNVRHNYYNTTRSTFMLSVSLYTLASKGFCSPEPPSEQKEDNNLHDGTGLGDGEGASNNSNDVEDDEDLSEQAQQPNEEKDKNNNDDDENDDAVDIEGDMAGNLEDASDQEDEEGEDNEENDLDEEIDDIDDLDPNAIDEKMWDEEVKEDKKEKDSENVPENATNDDDNMEANEDEEESNKKNNKTENSQEDQKEEDEEEKEGSDDEGEENDAGEQEDEVTQQDNEHLDEHVPESEALDLPDDMNLDGDDDDNEKDNEDDDFDDKMDVDEDDSKSNDKEQDEDNGEDEDDKESNDVDEEAEAETDEVDDQEQEGVDEDAEEIDEEGAENEIESDEETLANKDDEKEEEGGNDNAMDQDAEGVDGSNEDAAMEDIDTESAVKQESGDKGEGADNQVADDKDDIGATGNASTDPNQKDKEENEENSAQDDAREMAKESLKQLGDTLKEFHRRRQEIQESVKEEKEQTEEKAKERPDEFQHVDGENANFDTQALGAADKDQVQSLDDDMAIDDDIEDNKETVTEMKQEPEELGVNDEMEVDEGLEEVENQADADNEGKTKGAFIGDRDRNSDRDDLNIKHGIELDAEEDDDEVDTIENGHNVEIDLDEELPPLDLDDARNMWRNSELATQELASGLCEQLRLILEPTLATKLRGDFKTGKRLNMKRIIPYIASEFRKDKIWLRRTKPSKRQYQIMIAVDDSKSMSESKSTELAFNSIALVAKALTQLESGGLSIVRFGEDIKVVHPFDKPFNSQESGARIFQWFDFQQTKTDIKQLCNKSLKIFEDARSTSSPDLWQLQIIISDGVCEDHDTIERLVRKAREEKIMLVFVVIDGINSNESILDMSQVSYETDAKSGNTSLKVVKYLDTFPFEFYVVVRNINELPEMLALILRQYFTEVASI